MSLFRSTLTTVSGVMTFDASEALRLGGDPATVEQVAIGVTAGGGVVLGLAVDPSAVSATRSLTSEISIMGCVGETNVTTQWFGLQIKLNSCDANRLIGTMTGGGGVAGIIAVLASTGVGTVVAGVAAGILAIGAGVVAWCAADGNGLILDYSYAGPSWCAGQ